MIQALDGSIRFDGRPVGEDGACSTMDALDSQARRFWYAHHTGSGDLMMNAKLHADIALAIAQGDERTAEKASEALSTYLEDFARNTIDPAR